MGLGKAAMDYEQQRSFSDAFDGGYDWAGMIPQVEPILAGLGAAAGDDALNGLGLFDASVSGLMRADAKAYAKDRAAEMVGMIYRNGKLAPNPNVVWSIPAATRDEVRGLVTEALDEGWSTGKLATALKDSAAFGRERANTIARTETAMADTAGNVAGWKATGLVAGKEWLTAPDCCDECLDIDGVIVALGEDFEDGDPPLHPNCRCCLLPVLPEDMPDAGDEDTESDDG